MNDTKWLAARFEEHRGHLFPVAYRVLAGHAVTGANPAAELLPAVVNGTAGVVIRLRGQPFAIQGFTVTGGKIVEIDAIADARVGRVLAGALATRDR